MLKELEIRDFALIEHLRLPFTDGLNVLTGETGAGKSIIIDALNAVLGGKVGAAAIRNGAERALAEGTFTVDAEVSAWLKQNELCDGEPDELVVAREITKSGSKARINGTLINLSMLHELKQKLVTIHAQHEARTLQSPQAQLEMLDALGDETQKKLAAQVRTLYARRKELSAQISEINISEAERARRLEFAKFQMAELLDANLNDEDEDASVSRQIKRLSNVVLLETALAQSQQLLAEGDGESVPGAIELVQRAVAELTRAAEIDAALLPVCESLSACAETLDQEHRQLRKYRDRLDTDPETLAGLEARLAQLAAIKRKYGPALSAAICRRDLLKTEIEQLENSQTKADRLSAEQDKIAAELLKAATALSEKRVKLAQQLAQTIQSHLADVGMPHCKFVIAVDRSVVAPQSAASSAEELSMPAMPADNCAAGDTLAQCGPAGIDRVEFLIAPNPGQPLAPVAKIASGGELSRVMLAVKTIFAHADNISTVVFDEIETGLSGRTLQAMRDKLAKLALSHQILCITHQPLIASVANNHIEVSKQQSVDTTQVSAMVLDTKQRLKAVAAMASGQDNQAEALKFAAALFADSARLRAEITA